MLVTVDFRIRRVVRDFDGPWNTIGFVIPDQAQTAGPRLPVVEPCELPDGIQLVYTDNRGAGGLCHIRELDHGAAARGDDRIGRGLGFAGG